MARVVVLIPAYNSGVTLFDTLASLCIQNYTDFSVLIVDDCSTKPLEPIADLFSSHILVDVIRNEQRSGVAASLNRGLSQIDAEYVARLDSDDIAAPTRLADQVRYLDQHPNIDGVGSALIPFKLVNNSVVFESPLMYPSECDDVAIEMLFSNSLAHPSLMIRRIFFERFGLYDQAYESAEDYELWTRGISEGARFSNLGQNLTYFRRHGSQISVLNQKKQIETDIKVKRKYLSELAELCPIEVIPFFSNYLRFKDPDTTTKALSISAPIFRRLEQRFGARMSQRLLARILLIAEQSWGITKSSRKV